MLKHFFDISTGFRYKKMDMSSPSMYRDVHAQNDKPSEALQTSWPQFILKYQPLISLDYMSTKVDPANKPD